MTHLFEGLSPLHCREGKSEDMLVDDLFFRQVYVSPLVGILNCSIYFIDHQSTI